MEFSILMPVYMAEKYLREAAESVLGQSFSDYELVLAEDGSPDKSGALCDELAQRYPDKIRVLHLPHRGTILTRREAIRAARGEFILWLDSDDLMVPDTLEKLHRLRIQGRDPDIILYEFTAFYEDGRPDDKRPPLFPEGSLFQGESEKKPLYELLIRSNYLDSLCTKAVRRPLFQNDPTDYTPCLSNPYGEDALQALYPLTQADRILYTGESFCRYRMRQESVMHAFNPAMLDKRFNSGKLTVFEPFMKKWGLWDAPHRTQLETSLYRSVLDGILYFRMEKGYDQQAVSAYAEDFVKTHPRLKELSRDKALSSKQRLLLGCFSRMQLGLLCSAIRIKRRLSSLRRTSS